MVRRLLLALMLGALATVGVASTAYADTANLVGTATGKLATAGVTCTFNAQTNTLSFTIVNTSPFDARITAIGFDLPPTGNASKSGLNGFTGSVTSQPASTNFTFSDSALGKVPLVSGSVLDFGFVTGKNFGGGKSSQGLAPGTSATFVVSGAAFAGSTEGQICDSIVVRFQRVGADGSLGDVALPAAEPELGDVWLDKVISGETAPSGTTGFTFSVTCDGVALPNVTIAADDAPAIAASGIEVGDSCTIIELASHGAVSTSFSVDGGAAQAGSSVTVTITADGQVISVVASNVFPAAEV